MTAISWTGRPSPLGSRASWGSGSRPSPAARGRRRGWPRCWWATTGRSHKYVSMKHADAAELGVATFDERLPADTTAGRHRGHHRPLERRPGRRRRAAAVPVPGPPRLRRPADAARPGQGRRRPPPGQPRPPGHGRRRPGGVHARPGSSSCSCAYDVPIAGRHVVIVGRGLTIGRPLANLLALKRPNANAAVTVVHTGVADLGRLHPPGRHPRGRRRVAPPDHRPTWSSPVPRSWPPACSFEGKKARVRRGPEVAEVAGWLSPRLGGVGPMHPGHALRQHRRRRREGHRPTPVGERAPGGRAGRRPGPQGRPGPVAGGAAGRPRDRHRPRPAAQRVLGRDGGGRRRGRRRAPPVRGPGPDARPADLPPAGVRDARRRGPVPGHGRPGRAR